MKHFHKAPFKRVSLTTEQKRKWEDTLAALSWVAPGFVSIIYTMLDNGGSEDVALFTDDIQNTAATDGFQLILRPDLFFKYDLMERVFIVLHETMHECLNHVRVGWHFKRAGKIEVGGQSLPYSHRFANYMQDFIINDVLIESKMGKFSKDWLHDTDVASAADDWVTAYFRNWKTPDIRVKFLPVPGNPGDTQEDSESVGFDDHLEPQESDGKDPEEVPERNAAQWEIAINTAMEIQKAQGKLPGALQHFFDELLRPKVLWTDHIRGEMMRIAGSGAYDFRRLDRRMIIRGIGAPGMSGNGAGLVVVGGDSSMSIFADKTLPQQFIAEVGGMVEDVQPEETHVIWCDTEVQRVDVCTDPADVRKMMFDGIPGGGGTSFVPVFKYIEDNDLHPDVLVYLTDGDGEFPKYEPDYPVIWGDISGAKEKYPWGVVVHIPVATGDN